MIKVCRVPFKPEPRVPKLRWKNSFHFHHDEMSAVPDMRLLGKLPNFVISLLVRSL